MSGSLADLGIELDLRPQPGKLVGYERLRSIGRSVKTALPAPF